MIDKLGEISQNRSTSVPYSHILDAMTVRSVMCYGVMCYYVLCVATAPGSEARWRVSVCVRERERERWDKGKESSKKFILLHNIIIYMCIYIYILAVGRFFEKLPKKNSKPLPGISNNK